MAHMDTVYIYNMVRDTIVVKANDNIDVVAKIDVMYNNAWNRLIIFWTVLGAIIGIVVPWCVTWYQRNQLKIDKEELKKQIDESKMLSKMMEAHIAHFQGEFSRIVVDKFKQACIDYMKAAKYYSEAKAFSNACNSLMGFLYLFRDEINENRTLKDSEKIELFQSSEMRKDVNMLRQIGDQSVLSILDQIEKHYHEMLKNQLGTASKKQ